MSDNLAISYIMVERTDKSSRISLYTSIVALAVAIVDTCYEVGARTELKKL